MFRSINLTQEWNKQLHIICKIIIWNKHSETKISPSNYSKDHGRSQDFGSGENTFGGRPRGGVWGRSPPDAGEFLKIFKKIRGNCLKRIILVYFPLEI